MTQTYRELGPLADGGAVVVVGGGPGGVATAIALKHNARALGRQVRVIIVENKLFAGEHHYNQCVGVLSPPIVELLQVELGVPFPHSLTSVPITGYVLHTARQQIILDGESEPSFALRRVQFDAYMLEMARESEVMQARVTDLEFHTDRVVVYTDGGSLEADVVVGAFGLDEGTAVLFTRAVGYHPPPALSSVVTKYRPDEVRLAEFGRRAHAFLPALSRIEFGAITPKGTHLTLNIAGATADADLMDTFLSLPEVQRVLPGLKNVVHSDGNSLPYFKGRFPCGLARNFAGDRYVMVGDAAGLVRAFKGKGVTSAIQTGIRAAHTILHEGISARAFQAYHAANTDITDDLPYGQVMRHLAILAARFGLIDPVLVAAQSDPGLCRALFDAVSAHRTYREVVRDGFSLSSIRAVLVASLKGFG